jgi:hypothetical protein
MTSQEACDFVALGKKKMTSYKPALSATKTGKKPLLKDAKGEKKNKTE